MAISYIVLYNENMFKSDSSINYNYNSKKNTDIIAKIFEDHWNNIPSNINNQFVNTQT